MILPLFAFVNAGVDLREISLEKMLNNVSMGVMLGLFIGKQLDVFGFSWLAIVKSILDLHGGTIDVRSEPSQGTTILLRFSAK